MTALATERAALEPNTRVSWPDAARGVGIALVVFGHVIAGLVNAHVLTSTPMVSWTYFTIYTFHMPLFFLLSGLFLADGVKRGLEDFLIGKAWTIVYPYFLWSLVQGALQMGMAGVLDEAPAQHALMSIAWQPISQFWFLYALMLCHLLGLALKARPIPLLVFGVVGGVAANWLPFTNIIAKTLHFLPYYALGVALAPYALRWRLGRIWMAFIALVAFAAATVLGGFASGMIAEKLVVAPAALAGTALVVLLALLARDSVAVALQWLGRASMTILVLHILALVFTRMALEQLGIDEPAIHLAAGLAIGVLVPALIHYGLESLGALPLFGFARPRRAPAVVNAAS
ncbi:MAG: acyltransferase family protein [Pseudomonadota bacterium]